MILSALKPDCELHKNAIQLMYAIHARGRVCCNEGHCSYPPPAQANQLGSVWADCDLSKVVGITSMFVPVEWIHAHGLRAVLVIPQISAWCSSVCAGRCTAAVAMVEARQEGIPTVFVATCDQLRRAFDHWRIPGEEGFLLNVPITRSEVAVEYFTSELERLSDWLCGLGGTKPNRVRLLQSIGAYVRFWQTLSLHQSNASASAVVAFIREAIGEPGLGAGPWQALECAGQQRGPVIGIVSGHLTDVHLQIFREIESAGFRTRLLCADPVPVAELLAEAPWADCKTPADLARIHLEYTPHFVARPNARFHRMLWRLAQERAISGVLVLRTAWCDLLEPEPITIREQTGLHACQVMLGCEPEPAGHAIGRIAAFVEMFK